MPAPSLIDAARAAPDRWQRTKAMAIWAPPKTSRFEAVRGVMGEVVDEVP